MVSDTEPLPCGQNAMSPSWIAPCRANVRSTWMNAAEHHGFRPMPRSSGEQAERARRYAPAMTDKKVIDQLNEIAALALRRELCVSRQGIQRSDLS